MLDGKCESCESGDTYGKQTINSVKDRYIASSRCPKTQKNRGFAPGPHWGRQTPQLQWSHLSLTLVICSLFIFPNPGKHRIFFISGLRPDMSNCLLASKAKKWFSEFNVLTWERQCLISSRGTEHMLHYEVLVCLTLPSGMACDRTRTPPHTPSSKIASGPPHAINKKNLKKFYS